MKDLRIEFKIEDVKFVVTSITNHVITAAYPKHCHGKDSYEVHYIPFGYGSAIVDGVTYPLEPNSLFITGPGVFHEQIPNAQEPMCEYGINFDVFYKKERIKKNSAIHTFLSNTAWYGKDNQNIIIIFKQIFDEMSNRYTGYTDNLEALCKMLIILMIRNYEKTARSFQMMPEFSLNTARNLTIEKAFLYDYNALTLDSLSERIGLSNRQTERLLKEQYGKTFSQKRTEARMSKALMLLEEKKPITEIADILGYSSCEHFSNAFKSFFGKSTRNYRKG